MIIQEIYLLFKKLKLGKIVSIRQCGTYAFGKMYHVKVKKRILREVTEYTVCEQNACVRSIKSLQTGQYYYQNSS